MDDGQRLIGSLIVQRTVVRCIDDRIWCECSFMITDCISTGVNAVTSVRLSIRLPFNLELKPSPWDLFLRCFDTVGWVFWTIKPVPNMTYNVFDGTLNYAHLHPLLTFELIDLWPLLFANVWVMTIALLGLKVTLKRLRSKIEMQWVTRLVWTWSSI